MLDPQGVPSRDYRRLRRAQQRLDRLNPDRWGRVSTGAIIIAFGMLVGAIAVFTFYWITIANENAASRKEIHRLQAEYDILDAFVANFSTECNCSGLNFTFPTEFADDAFNVFNDADPSKLMNFDADTISAATLQRMTIQDASGTIAYLGDIPVFPSVFLDDVFAVVNAADNTKEVMLNCSVITTATTRIMSIQDASGTIAYLADIPVPTSIFEDDVFAVQNVADNTKEVQLDCSGISAVTTQFMTIQDASGTIAYLSDVGGANGTFSDAVFAVFASGDPTADVMLDVSGVTPGMTSVMAIQDKSGTIAYVDQVTVFVDVLINASRSFPDLANEGVSNLTDLGVTQLQIWGCGGGGGGGGASGSDGGGGGGSGSGVELFFIDDPSLFSTLTVTIGGGGAGATGAVDGGDGNTTSVIGVSVAVFPDPPVAFLELFGYGGAGGLNSGGSGGGGGGSGAPSINGTGGTAGVEGGLAGGDGGSPGVSGGFRYPWHAGAGGGDGSTGAGGAAGGDWHGGGAGGAGNAFSGGGGGGAGGLFGAGGDGGALANADGAVGGFCAGGGGAASTTGTGGAGGDGLVFIRYWTI